MEIEVNFKNIPLSAQHQITVNYKGKPLRKYYIADLICYDKIIVEINAMDSLTLREEGQLLNYLKATGIKVGVLINFGHYPSLEWKRLILTKETAPRPTSRTLREDETIYQTKISED